MVIRWGQWSMARDPKIKEEIEKEPINTRINL
jgi:hypothetical protein